MPSVRFELSNQTLSAPENNVESFLFFCLNIPQTIVNRRLKSNHSSDEHENNHL